MTESLLILKTVNDFYTSSFNQLTTIFLSILAFSGILLPVLISLYQKRIFKIEHEEIRASLSREQEDAIKEIKEIIEKKYETAQNELNLNILKIKKEMEKEIANLTGGIIHEQARTLASDKNYASALESISSAIIHYIEAADDFNIRRALLLLNEAILPNLDSDTIENSPEEPESLYLEMVKSLHEFNTKEIYTDDIRKTQRIFRKAKSKKTKTNNETDK